MKANELRIGNWYKWYAEGKYYEYQVKDIDFCNGNMMNFEPIQLTEEWLLRFGIYIDGQSISLKSGTIGVIQRNREGLFKYYLHGAFGMVHLDSIQHVHQLQNIYFALTGQELEIK